MAQERPAHLALGKKPRALDNDRQTRMAICLWPSHCFSTLLVSRWHRAASYLPSSQSLQLKGEVDMFLMSLKPLTHETQQNRHTCCHSLLGFESRHIVYFDFCCLIFPNAHLTLPCPKNSNFRLFVVEQHLPGYMESTEFFSELRKLCFSPIQSWPPESGRWQGVCLASDSNCCRCVSGYISVALQDDLFTVMIHRNRQQGEVKTLKIKSLMSCGVCTFLASVSDWGTDRKEGTEKGAQGTPPCRCPSNTSQHDLYPVWAGAL
jgi:hypothetical protein